MSVKKKTLLLALSFSSLSHAGSFMPACTPGKVTVPCTRSAWDLGLDGLYFRSEENALSLNSAYRASFGLGFRVEANYHWGSGHDINLNWAHYKKTTNNLIVGNLRSEFDIVNAEFGQHVDVGEHVDIRFHGGLQFAGLDSDENTIAIPGNPGDPNGDPPIPATPAVPAMINAWTVKAWGPRIGVDSAYNCGNGFALFANAAVR